MGAVALSAATPLFRLWVRIPPGCMEVSFLCLVV